MMVAVMIIMAAVMAMIHVVLQAVAAAVAIPIMVAVAVMVVTGIKVAVVAVVMAMMKRIMIISTAVVHQWQLEQQQGHAKRVDRRYIITALHLALSPYICVICIKWHARNMHDS